MKAEERTVAPLQRTRGVFRELVPNLLRNMVVRSARNLDQITCREPRTIYVDSVRGLRVASGHGMAGHGEVGSVLYLDGQRMILDRQ